MTTTYRIRVLQVIIPLITFIVVTRLFYWQVIRGDDLSARAASQHNSVVTLTARRGQILSSDESILAGVETRFLLYAYRPQLEASSQEIVQKVAPIIASTPDLATSSAEILPTPEEKLAAAKELLEQKLDSDRSWIALKHHLTREQRQAIEDLDIKGLGFDEQIVRFYPEASMSAHLLGFVGQNQQGEPQGYFGLEGYYDRQLQGRGGRLQQETDAFGNPILVGDYTSYSSLDGRTLLTSINRSLQYQIEKLLHQALLKYGAVQASAIVMEPTTGAVIALANAPQYDPRIFYKFDPNLHKNPAIADLFEPGSIFKPIVMAAAIDAGVVSPETKCDSTCDQAVSINQYTIKTWNDQYHPGTTMTEVIVNSDNTGMIFAARRLGKDSFLDYINRFGFSQATGIDLQEEITPKQKQINDFKDIDLATSSFGQGIAITRIQMLAAANVIANQGIWVQPHIVQQIKDGDKLISLPSPKTQQVISPETATLVTQMMVEAVDESTVRWNRPEGIKVAGKTGTAQIPVSGHYDEDKTIASFIGFAPAENPKFTMLVTLREPTSSPWGSETAAPLWFDIANLLLLAL